MRREASRVSTFLRGGGLALLLALLPLAVLAVRLHGELAGESAVGDLASFEIGVLESARGERLVGQVARFGFHQVGPGHFWMQVPLYVLSGGRSWALSLTALLVNWAALLGIAWAAFRWFESRATLLALPLVAAAYARFYEPGTLFNPWCQFAIVLPAAWFVLVAAAVLVGRRGCWPLLVALASFLVQGYGSTLPAATLVCGVAAAVDFRRWRRFDVGPALATILVVALFWSGPLIDALTVSPSNLERIVAHYSAAALSRGASGDVLRESLSRHLGGAWASLFADVRGNHPYPLQGAALAAAERAAVAWLVLVALSMAIAVRRGWTFSAATGGTCFLALAGAVWASRSLDDELYPYVFFWLSGGAAVGWLLAAGTALHLLGEGFARLRPSLVPDWSRERLLTLCAAALALATFLRPLEIPHLGDEAPRRLADDVGRRLAGREASAPAHLVMHDLAWIWGFAVLVELDHRGRQVTAANVQRGVAIPVLPGLQPGWLDSVPWSVELHLAFVDRGAEARWSEVFERLSCHPCSALGAGGREICLYAPRRSPRSTIALSRSAP